MSDTEAYMAVIVSPEGTVWEGTAAVTSGHEAEFRARRWAQAEFVSKIYGHLFQKGLDRLTHTVWEVARDNGFQCVVTPVTIKHKNG